MTSRVPTLIVHGGAGADPASGPEKLRRGTRDAVAAGWAVLHQDGGAIDAIGAAVCAMADNPRFSAGQGSVLTTEGAVEMDTSIMEGDGLICIDWKGRLGWAHSTPLMPVGFMSPGHDAPPLTY